MANIKKTTAQAVTDAVELEGVNNSEIERSKSKKKSDAIAEEFKKREAELNGETISDEEEAEVKKYEVHLSKAIPRPKVILYQDESRVFSLKNMSMVVGKEGSRKTTLCIGFIVALLDNKDVLGFHNPDNGCIALYVDTEQSPEDIAEFLRAVNKARGIDENGESNDFYCIGLRGCPIDDRFKVIKNKIILCQAKFVVIDGVADLIKSPNDEKESNQIIADLTTLIEEKEIHVLNVIHNTWGNEKARGHAGSHLYRKSETAFLCTNRGNYTEVTVQRSKKIPVHGFCFITNENGFPELTEQVATQPKQTKATNERKQRWQSILTNKPETSWTTLMDKLQVNFHLKPDTAKTQIKKALENNEIIKDKKTGYYGLPNSQTDSDDDLPF